MIMNKREEIEKLLLVEPQPDHLASRVLDLVDSYVDEQRVRSKNLFDMMSSLYYRYKRTSDEDIREHLKRIKIVRLMNKGPNTIHGYYPLTEKDQVKIAEKLRTCSLTFDATETEDTPMKLTVAKKFTFLVKSSSRFFLKPDIGEIFDALVTYRDLDSAICAICVVEGSHEVVPNTDGEHFLMDALLLCEPSL